MSNHVQSCVPSNNVRKHKTLLRRVAKTVRQKSGRLSVTPLAFNHNRFILQILFLSIVALCAHSMDHTPPRRTAHSSNLPSGKQSVKDLREKFQKTVKEATETKVNEEHGNVDTYRHGMAMRSGNAENMEDVLLNRKIRRMEEQVKAQVESGKPNIDLMVELQTLKRKRFKKNKQTPLEEYYELSEKIKRLKADLTNPTTKKYEMESKIEKLRQVTKRWALLKTMLDKLNMLL